MVADGGRRDLRPRRRPDRLRVGMGRGAAGVVATTGGHWRDGARAMMGMSSSEWSRYLHDELGVPLDPAEINRLVVGDAPRTLPRELPLLPGAVQAVRRLGARWPLGLASSSNRPVIDTVLEAGRRECLLCRHRIGRRGRPWQALARRVSGGGPKLGVEAGRAAAVEDSSNGLRAGAAAGLLVIAVPNREYPPADRCAGARFARRRVRRRADARVDRGRRGQAGVGLAWRAGASRKSSRARRVSRLDRSSLSSGDHRRSSSAIAALRAVIRRSTTSTPGSPSPRVAPAGRRRRGVRVPDRDPEARVSAGHATSLGTSKLSASASMSPAGFSCIRTSTSWRPPRGPRRRAARAVRRRGADPRGPARRSTRAQPLPASRRTWGPRSSPHATPVARLSRAADARAAASSAGTPPPPRPPPPMNTVPSAFVNAWM